MARPRRADEQIPCEKSLANPGFSTGEMQVEVNQKSCL